MHWSSDDFVVGIDLGGTKIDLAAAGADGVPALVSRLETRADLGARQALDRAFDAAAEIADTAGAGSGRCRMVALVTPGIARDGRIELAPNLPGIEELDLEGEIAERLGVRSTLANDVKAGAFAEARHGSLRGRDPAIFLSLGTGIAAAVVVGGEVIPGVHGAAGEIAYTLAGVADLGARLEGRAPLEELVGGRAIGDLASAILGERADAAVAFAHPSAAVAGVVDTALDALAVQIANMAVLIDPAAIAIAGGITGSSERLLGPLRSRVADAIPMPPEIFIADFAADAGLRGAIAVALAAAGSEPTVEADTEVRG